MKPLNYLILVGLFTGICFSLFYFHISNSSTTGSGMATDAAQYVKMMNGEPLNAIPKHYRFRILHPLLASYIPELPQGLFSLSPDQQILFRFGIPSLFGLILASFCLFLLLTGFGFTFHWSLIGTLLWLTGFYVLNWAFQTIPDSLSYGTLALSLVLIQKRQFWILAVWMVPALAVKETALLVIPFSLFLLEEKRSWLKLGLSLIPALVLYSIFRLTFSADFGSVFTADRLSVGLGSLYTANSLTPYRLLSTFLSFQWLWIPLVAGYVILWKTRPPIWTHALYFLPVFLLLPLAINASTVGRLWQYGFPVFIPVILFGMRHFFDSGKN
ncbi:MAG: hypothetical protein L6Q77_13895 [Bacteroidetes bacterium]|nr:hypothetical protein [Bacteroidota bacterium]